MKKIVVSLAAAFVLCSSCAQAQWDKVLTKIPKVTKPTVGLSNEQAVAGLREALNVGTDTAVSILTKADGFFRDEMVKILLPPEAQTMYKNLSKVPGGQSLLDKTILAMNRAAEDASREAAPIFKNAITSMTVSDGLGIVRGSENAATMYLKDKTYIQLKDAFTPKIRASLSKPLVFNTSAEDSYRNLINAYNKASLNGVLFEKINTNSLSEHVTIKGLDGLFLKVALQEKKIRQDPFAQVTDLLKKVFGKK